MFELVVIFKQEHSDTEVSIAQLDTGSQPPKQAKKSVDKDKKIGELKSRFSQDKIILEEYVRGILNLLLPFFVQSPLLHKLVQLVSTISHCFGHILHE